MDAREHKHRLPADAYRGTITVAFTAVIRDRTPIFNEIRVFDPLCQILIDTLNRWKADAHVFLFMSDHCHLLIEGKTDGSDLYALMRDFKQRSGYWFSKSIPNASVKWQKDFYDHILRKDEDIHKQILYILENPIRKGLVFDWKEYPFKGSTLHNFDEW